MKTKGLVHRLHEDILQVSHEKFRIQRSSALSHAHPQPGKAVPPKFCEWGLPKRKFRVLLEEAGGYITVISTFVQGKRKPSSC